jgi:hypothetical protein
METRPALRTTSVAVSKGKSAVAELGGPAGALAPLMAL